MTLKDLVMVMSPVGKMFINGKYEEPLQVISKPDISNTVEAFQDKEVLSIASSYTLVNDRIVGCLMVRIDYSIYEKRGSKNQRSF